MNKQIKRYCKDFTKIENYEKAVADNTQTWQVHHRLETHNSDGERRLVDISRQELIALDMYYDRPPEELIFLTTTEHKRLHNKDKKFSEEHRRKMSENNAHYWKGKNRSTETRKKIAESHKSRPAWNKGKKLPPRSEETRRKMSEVKKGKPNITKGSHYFNNGKINVRAKECPEGFVPGRLV